MRLRPFVQNKPVSIWKFYELSRANLEISKLACVAIFFNLLIACILNKVKIFALNFVELLIISDFVYFWFIKLIVE